jgi:hypothetical protein
VGGACGSVAGTSRARRGLERWRGGPESRLSHLSSGVALLKVQVQGAQRGAWLFPTVKGLFAASVDKHSPQDTLHVRGNGWLHYCALGQRVIRSPHRHGLFSRGLAAVSSSTKAMVDLGRWHGQLGASSSGLNHSRFARNKETADQLFCQDVDCHAEGPLRLRFCCSCHIAVALFDAPTRSFSCVAIPPRALLSRLRVQAEPGMTS